MIKLEIYVAILNSEGIDKERKIARKENLMLERQIIICDKDNFKKRIDDFEKAIYELKNGELDNHKLFNAIYKMELYRNAIYKSIRVPRAKLPDYPLPGTQEGISKYEDEYSDGILKIKIYELMPPVRTPYNNLKLERTCQTIAEKYKKLFKDKEIIVRAQVSIPRDNWDIDNRDLRYILNGFVYGGLFNDDNINYVSYMLEGIKGKENYIKIFISEKSNILNVCKINPKDYFKQSIKFIKKV